MRKNELDELNRCGSTVNQWLTNLWLTFDLMSSILVEADVLKSAERKSEDCRIRAFIYSSILKDATLIQ